MSMSGIGLALLSGACWAAHCVSEVTSVVGHAPLHLALPESKPEHSLSKSRW
jgi:hypothetical protein